MAAATRFQYWFWSYLAQPAPERAIYRLVQRLRPQRIVELGLVSEARTTRLVQVTQRFATGPVHYAGMDGFESRETRDGMPLKSAYRLLNELGVKPQFFPGDPASMVPMVANRLLRSDLVIVAPWVDVDKLASTWSFWPRMLHEKSIVALWNSGTCSYQLETYPQVVARAEGGQQQRRAA